MVPKKRSPKNRDSYWHVKAYVKVTDNQNLIPASKNGPAEEYYKKVLLDNIWKLTTQYKSCLTDARSGESRLNADTVDKVGRGSKIGKILRTSFMDGPLWLPKISGSSILKRFLIYPYF